MTEAELIAAGYGLIDDLKGKFSPEAEMRLHLHEVARDFAKRSRVMRKQQPVTYLTTGFLTLPEDCQELIQVLRSDGRKVCPKSATQLETCYGEDWQAQAGIPDYYTRDLTGVDQIRFSHIPTEAGAVTLTYIQGHVIGQPIELHNRYHGALLWGLAAKALAKSGNPTDQPKIAQFSAAYEAGLQEAARDAAKSFSNHTRRVPSTYF